MRLRWFGWFAGLLAALTLVPGFALADDGHTMRLPAGQQVESLIVTGQSVDVAGEVRGEVVVFFGDVHLRSTAAVQENVTVLGGQLIRDPGAQVGHGVYVVSVWPGMAASIGWGLAIHGLAIVLKLVWATGIVGVAIVWALWPRRLAAHAPSPWRSLAVGFLWGVALITCAVALAFTLWGIPVAGALLLAALVVSWIGLARISLALGGRLAGASEARMLSPWQQALVGAGFIVLSTGVPVLGPMVLVAWSCLGLGSFVLALRQGA